MYTNFPIYLQIGNINQHATRVNSAILIRSLKSPTKTRPGEEENIMSSESAAYTPQSKFTVSLRDEYFKKYKKRIQKL